LRSTLSSFFCVGHEAHYSLFLLSYLLPHFQQYRWCAFIILYFFVLLQPMVPFSSYSVFTRSCNFKILLPNEEQHLFVSKTVYLRPQLYKMLFALNGAKLGGILDFLVSAAQKGGNRFQMQFYLVLL